MAALPRARKLLNVLYVVTHLLLKQLVFEETVNFYARSLVQICRCFGLRISKIVAYTKRPLFDSTWLANSEADNVKIIYHIRFTMELRLLTRINFCKKILYN